MSVSPGSVRRKIVVVTAVVVGIALVDTAVRGEASLININRSRAQTRRLRRELDRMHVTIDSLRSEIVRLKTDTVHLERMAREKLGMARPDERVYKFIDKKE